MSRPSLEQSFGKVLRHAREQAEISQEELSFRAGVHRTYVSQIERGLKSPTLGVLFRLSGAVGIKPSELIIEIERDPNVSPTRA